MVVGGPFGYLRVMRTLYALQTYDGHVVGVGLL